MTILDKTSDLITRWLGSTASLIAHTIFFVGIFGLKFIGYSVTDIFLILTTAVSLEAIYLAVFIQRAVNKQGEALDRAVNKILQNTAENIEDPLDMVVDEIRKISRSSLKRLKKIEGVKGPRPNTPKTASGQ